jgi:hypothetical protein
VPRDAAQITDGAGHVWRLVANAACPAGFQEVLRDGGRPVAAFASCASVILFFGGSVSNLGDDYNWYGWDDSARTWALIGATAPDSRATIVTTAAPPTTGPSPNGTRVPRDAGQITDAGGHVWTLTANSVCATGYSEILRDGRRPAGAVANCGSVILFFSGTVSAIGDDNQWYRWSDASLMWSLIGAVAPDSGTTTPVSLKLSFLPSLDDASDVTSYTLDIFTVGSIPGTTTPIQSLDIGKPAVVGGEMAVDLTQVVASLSLGSYYCTVTAVGPGGMARSTPSNNFTR